MKKTSLACLATRLPIALLAIVIAAMPTLATAAQKKHPHRTSLPKIRVPAEKFKWPATVIADSKGNVYLAEGQSRTIRRIEPSVKVVTLVKTFGKLEPHVIDGAVAKEDGVKEDGVRSCLIARPLRDLSPHWRLESHPGQHGLMDCRTSPQGTFPARYLPTLSVARPAPRDTL